MRKKIFILAAGVAIALGVFAGIVKNNMLQSKKAYADPSSWVLCADFGFCWVVEDNTLKMYPYHPIYIPTPGQPSFY